MVEGARVRLVDNRSQEVDLRRGGHGRRGSQGSDSATINFVTDDRMHDDHREYSSNREHEEYEAEEAAYYEEEREQRHYSSEGGLQVSRQAHRGQTASHQQGQKGHSSSHYGKSGYDSHGRLAGGYAGSGMAVDYSSQDFRQSLAAIDAASRDGGVSRGENVRVRQHGDTTIIGEHRDPYSFYWQLDQQRREAESPPRRPPPSDYVIDEEEIVDTVISPDSHDSGIAFENQYSRPQRQPLPPPPPPVYEDDFVPLPPGWEKHQDPTGYSYYWHVDSGTIQRDPPRAATPPRPASPPPAPVYQKPPAVSRETQADAPSPPPPQVIQLPPQQPVIEEHAFKQTTTKRRVETENESDGEEDEPGFGKAVRFAVRSLGWTEISEEDLTAERSSRAVNRAIVDLSTGRNDVMDNVSKWGDGRELIMELDDQELTLIDPDTMTVVHSERIPQIRVWGVGRDNGRDFAYVARDKNSRRFMCHVFRCDTPAKTIANTLRDICRRLMVHRRPSTLAAIEAPERRLVRASEVVAQEEPRKVIRCHFLGVTQVPKATGIEILNEAVDRLVSQVRPERWILADVGIAPSTISINEVGGNQIAQCRVRYLSFLGIGRDVKHCAFIMHTSSENYMCYVFHVEPSAAGMAKTIEAACKLRYQKVLDAHSGRSHTAGSLTGKGWTDSLRDALGSVTQRIAPSRSMHNL